MSEVKDKTNSIISKVLITEVISVLSSFGILISIAFSLALISCMLIVVII